MPSPVAVDETPEPTHGHPGHEYPTHEHQMATSPVGSSQHVPPTPVHSEDDNAAGLKHIAPASSPGESQIEDVRSASSIGGLAANSALIEINQKLEAVEGVVDILKSTVGYDIDALRDDMEESIRNLHMDMLTQFHQQSQEMKSAFAAQQQMISDLVQENHKLREENQNLQNQV
uniref:Uncharacterized protein n=1 Tax=Craspedostauros australis TaxID=1486917 RepID=A0A7R9WPL7_9STRA